MTIQLNREMRVNSFSVLRGTETATTGREYPDPVSGLGTNFVFTAQVECSAVIADKDIFSLFSRLAPCQSIRGKDSPFGQDGHVEWLQKFQFADKAVTP